MRTRHSGKTPDTGHPRRTPDRTAAPAPRLHAAVRCSAVDDVSPGPGQSLAAPLTGEMKARPGADFSRVPIHADSAARDVLALQRSTGNAAVARMLEQARQQYGAGDGDQQTAATSVQRSAVQDVLRGPGQPMAAPLQKEMEARLGADFSHVRVHTDAAARASAAEVDARAYTSGEHVVLGPWGNDPHILAHELTHVIQQRLGPVGGTDSGEGLRISDPSDRFEREAEAHAGQVMSGAAPVRQTSKAQQMPPRSCPVDHPQLVIQRTPPPPPPLPTVAAPGTGWKAIEALLAALDDAGFTPAQIRDPELSLGGREQEVLANWRKTALKHASENQSEVDKWDVQALRNALKLAAEEQKRQDLAAGENYLSADYRRINPLLAALDNAGFTPAQIRDPELSLGDREREVLANWQKTAVKRQYAVQTEVDAWNAEELRNTLKLVQQIHRAWTDFGKPSQHREKLIRGDSENIYSSIPELDPATYQEKPGDYTIDKKIVWPTIMSTTYGDPKTHSFVSKKTVVWELTVEDPNLGRVLGGNNPSEEEVTFPVGTKLNINKVQLRSADTTPRVIVYARIPNQPDLQAPPGPSAVAGRV